MERHGKLLLALLQALHFPVLQEHIVKSLTVTDE